MTVNKLTPKQEAFAQAYLRTGNLTASYKEAYNASNMKEMTIAVRASKLSREYKVGNRIQELRNEMQERNRVDLDDLIQELSNMVRFDPADMYDENGNMKKMNDMPKPVRQMIAGLETQEMKVHMDGESFTVGHLKKVKLMDKLGAIEKLIKYFDGYNKHNKSKTGDVVIYQLPDNKR